MQRIRFERGLRIRIAGVILLLIAEVFIGFYFARACPPPPAHKVYLPLAPVADPAPEPPPPPFIGVGYGLGYSSEAMADHRGYLALGNPPVRLWGAGAQYAGGLDVVIRGIPLRKNGDLTEISDLMGSCGTAYGVQCEALAHPGSYWELGNEPNAEPDPNNSGLRIPAADYAAWFSEISGWLRSVDPTAKIGGPALGPGADEYAMTVYAEAWYTSYTELTGGAPDLDGLSIHPYPVRRSFSGHVADFRAWMQSRGLLGLPLYVTEIGWLGDLEPDDPDFVIGLMGSWIQAAFEAPTEPGSAYPTRVQGLFWFIPYHEAQKPDGSLWWADSFLWDFDGQLTEVGVAFGGLR